MSRAHLAAKLAKSPANLAQILAPVLQDEGFAGAISAEQASSLAGRLGLAPAQLPMQLAQFAQAYAVTPISGFAVGAVGMGLSGALYFGANLEVAGQSLSFSVHAEQSAIANAWIHDEEGLTSLAVTASPCGHCRQFLNELDTAASLSVELADTPPTSLATLLPLGFGPRNLDVDDALLRPRENGLRLSAATAHPTTLAALAAANAAYSPYTRCFAGVALRTRDGAIHTGRYAENAAHNPSLAPLGMALSQLILHQGRFDEIVEAVLVQAPGTISQQDVTQIVLRSVTDAELVVVMAEVADAER